MIHGAVLLYVNHSVIHTLNVSIKKSLFIQDLRYKIDDNILEYVRVAKCQ